jgi:hypothetical protein
MKGRYQRPCRDSMGSPEVTFEGTRPAHQHLVNAHPQSVAPKLETKARMAGQAAQQKPTDALHLQPFLANTNAGDGPGEWVKVHRLRKGRFLVLNPQPSGLTNPSRCGNAIFSRERRLQHEENYRKSRGGRDFQY